MSTVDKVVVLPNNILCVDFLTDNGAVTIINGKIRAQMGFITPAQLKRVWKMYYAIKKEHIK